mgnify:CR=1 FL=1
MLQDLNEDLNSDPIKEELEDQIIVKRPWGVYFVAFWTFFGLSIMIRASTLMLLSMFDLTERQFELGSHGSTLLLLYLTFGVILLNKPATYILTAILTLVSIFQTYSIFAFLIDGDFENRVIGLKLILLVFSAASAWYLLRPKFRLLSSKYREVKVEEKIRNRKLKDFNAMQKHISKQLSKNLK